MTLFKIYELRRQGEDARLRSNNLHLDLLRMKEAGYMAQCFALFTYMPYMQKLADALSAAGFTTGEIEKIFWRNAMRVYEVVLGD